jgi:hypothetical protein
MLKTSNIYKVSNEMARKELVECIDKCHIQQEEHGLKIPSHRKKEFISFEEYKEKILNGGFSKEIKKGTSKHLISFYNYFLKNQSTIINKEIFELEYNQTINSLDDISKKYNIPREHITYLRDFYGIKRKGATFIRRLANEKPLSQEAKDVIIGSLLGDGCIDKWGNFREKHSEKQVEYLEWKASFLKEIWNNNPFTYYVGDDKRSGTRVYTFQLVCKVHSLNLELKESFYKNGKKVVPENMEDYINEFVLAIWFMDDGITDWGYRNGIKLNNALPRCQLCSESFTEEENKKLKTILYEKFGLTAEVRFRCPALKLKPRIIFDFKSSSELLKITKKFAIKELLYKFDEQEYLKHKNAILNLNKELILKRYKEKHQLS